MKTNYYVPEEMKRLDHWIYWKLETNEKGQQTKIPYSPNYNGKASTTNPNSWGSYEKVKANFDKLNFSGIGFVFTKELGITFIDLDDCISDGKLNKFAENIISAFDGTFMELSQSGSGVHIFAKGNIDKAIKKDVIELYDNVRYVAFTGDSLNSCEIINKQDEIKILYNKYSDKVQEKTVTRVEPLNLDENEIIERIMQSKQASNFYYYYNGGAEANSENTLGLARILAFWCRNDSNMIKSIMYKSKLVRKKFDRKTAGRTWLDLVIDKAINSTNEIYEPTTRTEYVEKKFTEKDIFEVDLAEKGKKLYYTFNEFDYITKPKERILTGIKQLDYLLKGLELGSVSIITSATNGGKTTFSTMLLKEAIKQNEKVFFFNGEQDKHSFKNNVYKQTVDKNNIYGTRYKDTNIYDYYVKDEELERLKRLYGDSVYIFDNECKRDVKTLLYAMNEVNELHNVKMFILDNMMQIETKNTNNIYQEQSEIMEQLRTFAVNKNVHIVLVAHPKKDQDNLVRANIYSVSGSMNITNKAYNVISLIRVDHLNKDTREYKTLKKYLLANKYDIEECDQIVEVLKTKGEGCGVLGLKYDTLKKTYIELDKLTDEEVRAIKSLDGFSKIDIPF